MLFIGIFEGAVLDGVLGTLIRELESSVVTAMVGTGASSGLFPASGIDGLATLVERLSRKGHRAVSGDR